MQQPVRLTFREVCASRGELDTTRSLNDLTDDLLVRIFGFVVGPLKRQEHFVNNGILVGHEHMKPTMVSNFDDLFVMNLVCKRWNRIIQNSVDLWKNVHIAAVLLRIPREKMSWLKVFVWLSKHAWKIQCLHLMDESAGRDDTLDDIKLGALSLLSHTLKTLHLDNCFHRGANADSLAILASMKNLEQLQISCVNHDFIANVSLLAHLPNLQRLQIQGNGDYWDGHCPVLALTSTTLPIQLQVISLANVRVRGFHDAIDKDSTPLHNLKILELVYVEWVGPFVTTTAQLVSLEKLYVIESDKIVIEGATQQQESGWEHLSSCPNLQTFILRNGRYGDFCLHMSRDFSGLSALSQLRELDICPDASIPVQCHYAFDDDFIALVNLTQLSLTNIGLLTVPLGIARLPGLTELNLSDNKLVSLPPGPVSFASCLKKLILDSNAFTEIPNLEPYRALTELHVSNNPLRFYRDADYLASLPCLRILRLGNRRLLDVFPIQSGTQVDEICKDLGLGPVGGFHLGSLCSSLRHSNPKCKLLM